MKIPEVTLDEIKDARARIRDKVNKTPCIYSLRECMGSGLEI